MILSKFRFIRRATKTIRIGLVFIVTFITMLFANNNIIARTEANFSIDENKNILPKDAQEYARRFNVSHNEAERRLLLQTSYGELNSKLSKYEANNFLGIVIKHEPAFQVLAGFIDPDKSDLLRNALLSKKLDNLVVKRTKHSQNDLLEKRDKIITYFYKRNIQIQHDLDIEDGSVHVYIEENALSISNVIEAATNEFNYGVPVQFYAVGGFGQKISDIYAGLWLTSCTAGFTVINASSGQRGISTAGHCPNSLAWGGQSLPFVLESFNYYSDVQWHTVGSHTARNLAYDGSSNRYIYGTKSQSSMIPGEWVCRYGAISGYQCNSIYSTNWNSTYVAMYSNWTPSTHCNNGDSGGPVMLGNTAYGILTAKDFAWGGAWPICIFAPVDQYNNIGVYVATN